MQYLAICEDDLLFQFMRNVAAEQREVRYLVPNEKVARAIKRRGGKAWAIACASTCTGTAGHWRPRCW